MVSVRSEMRSGRDPNNPVTQHVRVGLRSLRDAEWSRSRQRCVHARCSVSVR